MILYFNEEIGQNHQISHMLIWHCATLQNVLSLECFYRGNDGQIVIKKQSSSFSFDLSTPTNSQQFWKQLNFSSREELRPQPCAPHVTSQDRTAFQWDSSCFCAWQLCSMHNRNCGLKCRPDHSLDRYNSQFQRQENYLILIYFWRKNNNWLLSYLIILKDLNICDPPCSNSILKDSIKDFKK